MANINEVTKGLKQRFWDNQNNRTGLITASVLLVTVLFLVYNYYEKTGGRANAEQNNQQNQSEENNQNNTNDDNNSDNGDVLSDETQKDYTSYVVAPGDSLWTIAEVKLGDPFKWNEIATSNNLERNNNGIYALEIGQELKIPVTVASNDTDPQLADTAIGSEPTVYTVQTGDSLWSIAEQVYGDGNQWQLIDEANTLGRLPNGRPLIHTGNQLICPALQQ